MPGGRFWKGLLRGAFLTAHAAVLVGLTFFFMSTDYMHDDEAWMIKNTAAVLRLLLPEPDKPDRNEFAFVNVSHDLALIERTDAYGMPAGNKVITNRARLAEFFSILNKDPNWKFLLCDIFFVDPSPADSLLEPELQKLPRAIFSHHLHDSGGAHLPRFKGLELGLADYFTLDDEFLKFRLVREGYKTVPMRMFEEIDGGKFAAGSWFWSWNGQAAFNDFVLDFRIRNTDLYRDPPNYPYADLNFLMETAKYVPEELHAFTKDRIVVVGDFDLYDMHETMYGDMPGPLILTNLYLALREGDMRLHWGFPLLLWLVYFWLSYTVFKKADFFEDWFRRRISESPFLLLLAQGISYLLILALVSIVTFVLFNFHFNFLFLAIYFNVIEWGLKYRLRRIKKRQHAATT